MADRDSQITFRTSTLEELKERLSGNVYQQQQQKVEIINEKPPEKKRLNSLDILRGLTMMGMVIVDCRGPHAPWFIKHVDWNGLSPADFVFPSFLFIMGMAVPLAINQKNPLRPKNIVRISALFLIGVYLNLFDDKFNLQQFRVWGILQRLSICYLLVVVIHCLTAYGHKSYRFLGTLIAISIGLIYICFMLTFQDLPTCPYEKNLTKYCNFGAYLDRKMIGQKHMLSSNDPQGLFTNLSAFLNAYIGYRYTLIMLDNKDNVKRIISFWVIFALLLGSMVYPLTILMPLNKKIWSISFVFLTAAASGIALTVITYLVDVLGQRHHRFGKVVNILTKPSIWLGRNPLAVFIVMELVASFLARYIIINNKSAAEYFYQYVFESWIGNPQVASTIFPIFFLVVWTIMAAILFKFNIFIRL